VSRAVGGETEVLAAANRLLADFADNAVDDYFSAFRPDATFLFHNVPGLMGSLAAYREQFARWQRQGFRVLAYESREQSVHLLESMAIFTHRSETRSITTAGEEDARERETIVFVRAQDGGWLGVHEHLSLDD
jgi:ketosteroid isomerase-like protein